MSSHTMISLGRALAKDIGAHNRMRGRYDSDKYNKLQRISDIAIAQLKYLIMHLDSREDAVTLANAAGCPGYINFR